MYSNNTSVAFSDSDARLSPSLRGEWGIPFFDKKYRGLPQQSFNLLETEDRLSGLIGIARFINTGLAQGETVTLITFESPENTLNRLIKSGYDFRDYIQCERLFILSYKSTFTRSLNISTDYQNLFAEINALGNSSSTRLAFLNADLLFNLESYNLTLLSLSKIHGAAKATNSTILAQFITVDSQPHRRLRNIGVSLLDCYLIISRSAQNQVALRVEVLH